MVLCGKCSVDLSSCKEILSCLECKETFHVGCTRVESTDAYKKLSAKKKSNWKCDACSSETASSASRGEVDLSTILESIQASRSDLSTQMSGVRKDLEDVRRELSCDIKEISSTIVNIQSCLSSLSAENEARKNEYAKIVSENEGLRRGMEDLRSQIRDIDQYSRKDNIEIAGVILTRGENIYNLLEKIARVIKVECKPEMISVAHRLSVTDRRPNPPIIVRFTSRIWKTRWMEAARQYRSKMTNAELANNLPSTPFFFNDHLTVYYRMLFGRANQLRREKKLAFVWTRDSKVFVRKSVDPQSPVVLLKSTEDLERLVKD